MPPPVEDVSDDESTGGSIPYDDSEKPKTTGGDEGDENNEEGEGEDGIYVVEKILGHDFAKNGTLLLHVKWKGYENPEDETMEPEENLLEGAKEVLDEYYRLQGGRPQPPQPQPRKRKSIGESKVTSQKAEPKKRRRSKGADAAAADGKDGDVPDWVPKTKSWENEVVEVDTILRDPDTTTLFAYLHWTNGKKSKVSIDTCYEKCPMKMLKFYEQHLVFKDG